MRNCALGCFAQCKTGFARCKRLLWDSRPRETKSLLSLSLKHFLAFWLFWHLYQASGVAIRDQKNHDSQRRDKILRFFLRPEIGQFLQIFGAISLLTHTLKPGEEGKNPLEWRRRAPRTCRFLCLVVVERALKNTESPTQSCAPRIGARPPCRTLS